MSARIKKSEALLLLILLAFALAISAAGWGYYKHLAVTLQTTIEGQLIAVADLKVSQISRWREERLNDANLILDGGLMNSRVQAFLQTPADPQSRAQLIEVMTAFQRHRHFGRVVLLDTQLEPRLSIPETEAWVGPLARRLAAEALKTNEVKISDLHISQVSGRINMDLLVPVHVPALDVAAPVACGLFLLEIDPDDYLFPSLQTGPTRTRTSETLLVRREGDRVIFLNELRHQTNTALKLSFSISSNPELPAARAALGQEGTFAGKDYRQVSVLAALRSVPGSPWMVVAKQDEAEINEPLRQQAWTISLVVAVLILTASLGVSLVWRNRELHFSLEELEARKQAATALQQNAERWRGFTAAAFEGICVTEQGRILDVNEQFVRLFGYERTELIGAEIITLIAPESRALVMETVLSGRESPYEQQWLRKDGSLVDGEAQARRTLWDGRTVRVTAVRDITERKNTQAALQKRIIALTQPLDASSDISFSELFDLEEIQKIQDCFAKVTGVASIITRPDGTPLTRPSNFCRLCSSIIRKTEKGRCNCFASDAVLGRHNPSGPIVQPCLSGALWDAGASIAVGGKHIANWLVGQVRDETQDEAQLMGYAKEIGADPEEFRLALREVPVMSRKEFNDVAEAVFILANSLSLRAYQNTQQARFIADRQRAEADREQLLQELVRKNKELETIVYISSHDLRSPLVNIQGFSHRLQAACTEIGSLLAGPEVSPALQAAVAPLLRERIGISLNFILGSVLKMDSLLNGLLRLSRLGRSALHMENLDMNRLVRSATDALAFQIQKAGGNVEVSDLPQCRGDSTQISQVLTNLLDNALKYCAPDRPPLLRIQGEIRGQQAVYRFDDNGLGISSGQQEKIWEVFQRLDPSGPVKGEGLGLAIVRRILDRHEGRAWVESEPGRGSSFFIALPTVPPEKAGPQEPTHS